MIKYFANTENKPTNILVGVSVIKPIKVRIRAIDPNKKGACYLNRFKTIQNSQDFEIRLPQSPKKLLILIDSPELEGEPTENVIKINIFLVCQKNQSNHF